MVSAMSGELGGSRRLPHDGVAHQVRRARQVGAKGREVDWRHRIDATFERPVVELVPDADLAVDHGPHRLRGLELYKGKPIFYSLGNFFGQNELVAAGRMRVIAKAGRVSPGPTKGARS